VQGYTSTLTHPGSHHGMKRQDHQSYIQEHGGQTSFCCNHRSGWGDWGRQIVAKRQSVTKLLRGQHTTVQSHGHDSEPFACLTTTADGTQII